MHTTPNTKTSTRGVEGKNRHSRKFTIQQAKEWQKNPETIKTSRVQLWSPAVMMGLIDLAEAKELVAGEKCFVITDQAIGFYDKEGF